MSSSEDISLLSDEDLIQRIVKTNDPYLFTVLYDRYSHIVYNKCYGFSSSKEEAQDLTHDVFIKLFLKLRTFKSNSKFSTWLYSFVYNFCVNHVTRNNYEKNKRVYEDESTFEITVDSSEENLLSLKTEKLKKALDLIHPNDKMILLLKYQDDFSIKEIQEALDMNASAVKMRLKRARAKVIKVYQNLI